MSRKHDDCIDCFRWVSYPAACCDVVTQKETPKTQMINTYPTAVSVGSPRKLCFLVCCGWVFDCLVELIRHKYLIILKNVEYKLPARVIGEIDVLAIALNRFDLYKLKQLQPLRI